MDGGMVDVRLSSIILSMHSYGYNVPKGSMSRLDELLNRNELIYQNLKQKLEGINQSSQNIYKNINHIHTNFSDPFSQESSAIQREPTIKNHSIKIDLDEEIPRFHHTPLERIEEHQEITFSEDQHHIDLLTEEMRLKRLLVEEERLRELEIALHRERELEERRMAELQMMRREREESERRYREESSRGKREESDRMSSRVQSHVLRQDYSGQTLESRMSALSERKRNSAKEQKVGIKNNSIYLNKIPKTSPVQPEEEIPTFRQSYSQKKDHRLEEKPTIRQEQAQQSSSREMNEQTIPRSSRSDEKIRKVQSKREQENYRYENEEKGNYQISSIKHNDHFDNHDTLQINLQNTLAKTHKTQQHLTPYGQLNSHFKTKLEEIDTIPQCYLFAPFNKVYRSPILQIKGGCVMLERKSKTSSLSVSSRCKIVDGLKYKLKNIMTDEQLLLKNLFCSQQTLNFEKKESNRVAIVGGREALKKKIHMGLLAYCHQQLAIQIQSAYRTVMVKLEHQSITPSEEPSVIELTIQADPNSKKISLMQLQKMVSDIYEAIKKWNCRGKKILRMTKIALIGEGNPEWTYSIISTNRYDFEFLKHLKVNKICWSINPLIKYYEDVKETLDSMRSYMQSKRTA